MAAHQAPLSLGFSRQEHWSGLPFPPPTDCIVLYYLLLKGIHIQMVPCSSNPCYSRVNCVFTGTWTQTCACAHTHTHTHTHTLEICCLEMVHTIMKAEKPQTCSQSDEHPKEPRVQLHPESRDLKARRANGLNSTSRARETPYSNSAIEPSPSHSGFVSYSGLQLMGQGPPTSRRATPCPVPHFKCQPPPEAALLTHQNNFNQLSEYLWPGQVDTGN